MSRKRALIGIRRVAPADRDLVGPLCELIRDAVHSGASVGFLAPMAQETALRYWEQVYAALGEGLVLWVAVKGGEVIGAVQLAPCLKENGRHRAELQKLFVLSTRRGQGAARPLVEAAEDHARGLGCTLLVLDTLAGSFAEVVYAHLGWTRAGEIPDYAATPDGILHPTAYYYKRIGKAAP